MKPILFFMCLFCSAFSFGRSSFTLGMAAEFDSLHPHVLKTQAGQYIFDLIGRTLVIRDSKDKLVPALAESIPTLENKMAWIESVSGKPTLKAKWVIRKNARWSDGKPVLCEDFKFALDVANSLTVSVAMRELFSVVEKVEWKDPLPQTCTFTYSKVSWNYNLLIGFFPLPSHIEKAIFEKYSGEKEGYDRHSLFVTHPETLGLHTGPYKVSEVKLGSHVTLVVNPFFYGPKPKIDKIVVKLIPNGNTLMANLESHTLDGVSPIGLTFDQALEFDQRVKDKNLPFQVLFRSSVAYEHLDFNLDNPIFKDKRVRQALLYSLDRKELVKSFFKDKQQAAYHFLPPTDPWATRDPKFVKGYIYNLRKAKSLLDEAGWKINDKDKFRYKDGQRLYFELAASAEVQMRSIIQVYLKDVWAKIGVDVIVKAVPSRVLYGDILYHRKFPGAIMFADSANDDLKTPFHTSQIPSETNSWSGRNFTGWSNAKADGIIEKMNSEMNDKKRADLAHQVIALYTEDIPSIPLYYKSTMAIVPKDFKNYRLASEYDDTKESEYWE